MSILERVVTFMEAIVGSYRLYEACHFPTFLLLSPRSILTPSLPKAVIDVKYGSVFIVLYLIELMHPLANTEHLSLEGVNVKLDKAGNVIVDDYQETSVTLSFERSHSRTEPCARTSVKPPLYGRLIHTQRR